MFELSIAKKYLKPKWRQLSVSIISLISILVISLVVWLIVVFFSVTNGLEKSWVDKLIALTAPVRITPTENYFNSYYYQIDSVSGNSDYTLKNIREKLETHQNNPYDSSFDEELPSHFPYPLLNEDGSLKDLIKEVYKSIEDLQTDKELKEPLKAEDYEVTMSQLKVFLNRPFGIAEKKSTISQATYLASYSPENKSLEKTLLSISTDDLNNVISSLQKESKKHSIKEKITQFFDQVKVTYLKTPFNGWKIPYSIWPKKGNLTLLKINVNGFQEFILPPNEKALNLLKEHYKHLGFKAEKMSIQIEDGQLFYKGELLKDISLVLPANSSLDATLIEKTLEQAKTVNDLLFQVSFKIDSALFEGPIPYTPLLIDKAHLKNKTLSFDGEEGILLPKTFKDAGVLIGDKAVLSYYTPTFSAIQEQQAPAFVSGFYDPGLIPMGGKFVLAKEALVNLISSSQNNEQTTAANGINIRFNDLGKANLVKTKLETAFKKAGIDSFFKIETYQEYEFTKDILEQLRSDKRLFSLISAIIIIVACSNIISMLIIMVNDKKTEIGILRSIGATSFSIAFIFGLCGIVMGIIGSLIGTLAAYFTLKNMDILIHILNHLQGQKAFNPLFYGETLPSEISFEALFFVILSTTLISLIAGIVPAVKATMLRPSAILRSE